MDSKSETRDTKETKESKAEIFKLFSKLEKNKKKLLKDAEIHNLLKISLNSESENREPLLISSEVDFLYQVAWLLITLGYEKTYSFLNINWSDIFEDDIRKKITFRLPLLNNVQEKFLADLDVFQNTSHVEAGEKCRRCGSEQTISIVAQTRSCDEASTISIVCLECRFQWRAQ